VLPSLPTVQGVITGGSSYGAVEAFLNAKRPLPCAVYDNTGLALRFWMAQHQKDGYNAYSYRTEPGQAQRRSGRLCSFSRASTSPGT